MNVINLKVNAVYFPSPTVLIDGKPLRLRKVGSNMYDCRVETDAERVNLSVCKAFELDGKFWFLIAIAYFIISVFGIFDAFYDKRFYAVKYEIELNLNGISNVELTFNKFESGKRAIVCRCDCSADEIENEYFVEENIKRRYKVFKKVKLITWIALLAAAAIAVILAFAI